MVRETWRTWYSGKAPWRTRKPRDVRYIVLHHTASPRDQSVETIRRFHEKGRGWPHVGYHYIITWRGEVHKTLPEIAVPICVGNLNPQCLCIALIGDFTKDGWPALAPGWRQAWRLALDLQRRYPDAKIVRHKDLVPTACPGNLTWGVVWERAMALQARGKMGSEEG